MTTLLAILVTAKFEYLYRLIEEDRIYVILFFVIPTMGFVGGTVSYLCPIAAGSSLPECKGFLNGANIPGLFSVFTSLVKGLGVILTISCGFPVGREGPMVQIGCAVAYNVLKFPVYRSLLVLKGGVEKFKNKNLEADKLMQESALLATIGGAAGIATAFRSPIGGICYMMEDMASYWNHETTVRCFGATMIATMVFSVLLDSAHGINYSALVIFDDQPDKADWVVEDLPWFLILAVFAGVLSAVYSEMLFLAQRVRRHRKNFKSPMWKVSRNI